MYASGRLDGMLTQMSSIIENDKKEILVQGVSKGIGFC